MPDLNVSNDTLDFGTVKCGECKIATIQLKNPQEIRCEWIAAYPGVSFFQERLICTWMCRSRMIQMAKQSVDFVFEEIRVLIDENHLHESSKFYRHRAFFFPDKKSTFK